MLFFAYGPEAAHAAQPPRRGGAIAAEYACAIDDVFGGAPVRLLPLARIIASTRAPGRPKEGAVVDALPAALDVIEAVERPPS